MKYTVFLVALYLMLMAALGAVIVKAGWIIGVLFGMVER